MTESVFLIPCGKHIGKDICQISDDVLLAMQGSWTESRKLHVHPFLAVIKSEVARRGLPVLDREAPTGRGWTWSKKEKKALRRGNGDLPVDQLRATVERYLIKRYGENIPDSAKQAVDAIFQ